MRKKLGLSKLLYINDECRISIVEFSTKFIIGLNKYNLQHGD
jgi:hypothetical protein